MKQFSQRKKIKEIQKYKKTVDKEKNKIVKEIEIDIKMENEKLSTKKFHKKLYDGDVYSEVPYCKERRRANTAGVAGHAFVSKQMHIENASLLCSGVLT